MFRLQVSKTRIEVLEVETITSGAKNAIDVKFCFSEDWKGLTKTAFFRSGKPSREVTASWLLNNENICKIPAEVLTRPNLDLFVGVRGNASTRQGGDVVIPTIWAKLGEIKEGANGGDESENITPEEYEKLLGYISGKQDVLSGEEVQYVGFDKDRRAVAKNFSDTVVSKNEFDEYKSFQEKALDDKVDSSGGTVTGPLLFVEETSVSSNVSDEEQTERGGVSYSARGIYKGTQGPFNIQTVSNHIQFAEGENNALLSGVEGDSGNETSVPNYRQLKTEIQNNGKGLPTGGKRGMVLKKISDEDDSYSFEQPDRALVIDEILIFSEEPIYETHAKTYIFYDGIFNRPLTQADIPYTGFAFGKYTDEETAKTSYFSFKWNLHKYVETTGRCEITCQHFVKIPIADSESSNTSLPTGGITGQVLTKLSEQDSNVGWKSSPLFLTKGIFASSETSAKQSTNIPFSNFNRIPTKQDVTDKLTGVGWGYISKGSVDVATAFYMFSWQIYSINETNKIVTVLKPQCIIVPTEKISGPPGADGFSPTVSTAPNATNDGTVVTITDKAGPNSFEVLNGEDGVTFTPSVSEEGVLSWTNDGGLPNPEPTSIKGPSGEGTTGVSIPSGGIIIWSGSTIPDGWALCNGENGTPDLRGKFVLGATTEVDEEGNTIHPIGETGGEEEVVLTKDQIPNHSHTINIDTSIGNASGTSVVRGSNPKGTITSVVNPIGKGEGHNNMPPYYTLAYIMKL